MKFICSVIAYIGANVMDCILTLRGLEYCEEWNPVARDYIQLFGFKGLILYKVLICSGLILGATAIHIEVVRGHTSKYAELILIVGTLLTVIGCFLWHPILEVS